MRNLKFLLFSLVILLISCSKNGYEQKVENGIVKHQNKITPNNPNFKIDFQKIREIVFPDSLSFSFYDIDSQGNIYVFDKIKGNIIKYDLEGKQKALFGRYGSGPGEYSHNVVFLLVVKDLIFVQDIGRRKIVIFDSKGDFVRNINANANVAYLSIIQLSENNFVASSMGLKLLDEKKFSILDLLICNREMIPKDTIFSESKEFKFSQKTNVLDLLIFFTVDKINKKIALAKNSDDQYQIDIFDETGKKIETIRKNYRKLVLADEEVKELAKIDNKSNNKNNKITFNMSEMSYKKAINHLLFDNKGRLWVFSSSSQKSEFICADIFENGKFLNRIEIPFIPDDDIKTNIRMFKNLQIKDDKIYYLDRDNNKILIHKY